MMPSGDYIRIPCKHGHRPITRDEKFCAHCEQVKPLRDFGARQSYCKRCHVTYSQAWRQRLYARERRLAKQQRVA